MSLFTKLGNDIASPVDAAGNKRSVENIDFQRWMTEVERLFSAFQAGGGVIFPDLTTANASLDYGPNQMAWVMGGDAPGIYRKVGASGTGSWSRMGDLPLQVIPLTNVGAGSADAIIATPSLPLPTTPGAALFTINIIADNTGPVTINGKPWRTNVGNEFVAGGIKAGGIYLFLDNGDHYRSITDQDVSALVAQAEAEANRAQGFAAMLSADKVKFKTVPLLIADDTMSYSVAPGKIQVGAGDMISADGFAYEVAASDASAPWIVETANGVRLAPRPDTKNRISTAQFGIPNATASPWIDEIFQAAVDLCKSNGWCLFQPEWSDIILSADEPVVARMVHLDLRGRIRREDADPVMIVGGDFNGGFWYDRNNPNQSFGTVTNTATVNGPALIVKGLRGSVMRVNRSNYVLLYADTHSSTNGTDTGIAYNKFHFLDVHVVDLDSNPDTDGSDIQWINENAFYCKRIQHIYIGRNSTYRHNHNVFYTPNIEGSSASIVINWGTWNQILDARFEGTPTVHFGPQARDNTVEYSWVLYPEQLRNPNSLWRDGRVTYDTSAGGANSGNRVINKRRPSDSMIKVFDFNAGKHQVLATNENAVTGGSAHKLVRGTVHGFDTIKRSSFGVIVEWTPLIPFGNGWRFFIGCDQPTIRVRFRFYNEHKMLVTSEPGNYNQSGGGTAWDAGNNYLETSITNLSYWGVEVRSDEVKFVSFQLSGGTNQLPFRNLYAYIEPNFMEETLDNNSRFSIDRIGNPVAGAGAPNRGVPYLGQRVEIVSGGHHKCTFALSTVATGARSAGNTTIGVDPGDAEIGDRIGVQCNNGEVLWAAITAVGGSDVSVGTPLPGDVAIGNRIEIWRWFTDLAS